MTPYCLNSQILLFGSPIIILRISNGQCHNFLNSKFLCQIRNQRPKRHKNGWCSHHIAENMVITTHPTVVVDGTQQGDRTR